MALTDLPVRNAKATGKTYTLGDYDGLSLIAKGTNPRIARKQKQQAARLAGEYTFMAVYEKWLSHRTNESRLAAYCVEKLPGVHAFWIS